MRSQPKTASNGSFVIVCIGLVILFSTALFAQSTEPNSPTPITTNQLSGQILARDIGDSRLTTYYYIFEGKRGDIFINVVTVNFNGDFDIFTRDGLKPRTKITIYADSSENETGRVVYMRKPEKLILRIQGRSPNDDPATFQIKFAGSFGALAGLAKNPDLELPEIDTEGEGTVRVNSVGTIIEEPAKDAAAEESTDILKPTDTAGENIVAATKLEKAEEREAKSLDKADIPATFDPRKKPETVLREPIKSTKPRVVIDDPFADNDEERREVTLAIKKKAEKPSTTVTIERVTDETEAEDALSLAEKKAAALAKIKLIVLLKDGTKFEKIMNTVSSFNVFDGVLKVVSIDGKITKFSILDVEKITIE